jgi:hypothetical protein
MGFPDYDLNLGFHRSWDFLEFLSNYLTSYFHLRRIYVQSNHTHKTERHGRVVNGLCLYSEGTEFET